MTMLQHYYTSTPTGTSGGGGFQCKAMSSGISADDLNALNKILGYQIPYSMAVTDLKSHPIALRYVYWAPDKCVLLCSQSNGEDEVGRSGNFFAHSVITSPKDFETFPPIMFYRHPFWKTRDNSSALEIPGLACFDLTPSMEFEAVWEFLKVGNRREWFEKLLNAVISFEQVKRPIVLLDSTDNIAMWILAVSVALPVYYRSKISFATYHHDPYQATFMITGTTADSKFRFSSDEYFSYFILNAAENRISETGFSDYVSFIAANFTPELYDDNLLDFFLLCNHQLPFTTGPMDVNLNLITKFFLTVRSRKISFSDESARDCVRTFISKAESMKELSRDDVEDLLTTLKALIDYLVKSPDVATAQDYGRTLRLLKKYHPALKQEALNTMAGFARALLNDNGQVAKILFEIFGEIFGPDYFKELANRSEFLRTIIDYHSTPGWHVCFLLWKNLMPFIEVNAKNRVVLSSLRNKTLLSISLLPVSDPDFPSEQADRILTSMIQVLKSSPEFLLEASADLSNELEHRSFNWLYYAMVRNLTLDQRVRYRNMVSSGLPGLLEFEARCDIKNADTLQIGNLMKTWIDHAEKNQKNPAEVFKSSMDGLFLKYSGEELRTIIGGMLGRQEISSIIAPDDEARLLKTYFVLQGLVKLNKAQQNIYARYYESPHISQIQKGMIGGSLAMSSRKFIEKSQIGINKYFASLDESMYKIEAGKLINEFFGLNFEIDDHLQMLQSAYVQNFGDIFWDIYWHKFVELMLDRNRTIEFVKLLSFWFDESPSVLGELPYIAQTFFLELPGVISEVGKEKDFDRACTQIKTLGIRHPWFHLVEDMFASKKKNRLLKLFSR